MSVRVFHDAVIEQLVRTPIVLRAACSMVSVYEGGTLIRQESGTLTIAGQVPRGEREPAVDSEADYDDASILELAVEAANVSLLVEWENYSTDATEVHRYVRMLGTVTWEPEQGGRIVVAALCANRE